MALLLLVGPALLIFTSFVYLGLDKVRFKSGMENLTDQIHALGL